MFSLCGGSPWIFTKYSSPQSGHDMTARPGDRTASPGRSQRMSHNIRPALQTQSHSSSAHNHPTAPAGSRSGPTTGAQPSSPASHVTNHTPHAHRLLGPPSGVPSPHLRGIPLQRIHTAQHTLRRGGRRGHQLSLSHYHCRCRCRCRRCLTRSRSRSRTGSRSRSRTRSQATCRPRRRCRCRRRPLRRSPRWSFWRAPVFWRGWSRCRSPPRPTSRWAPAARLKVTERRGRVSRAGEQVSPGLDSIIAGVLFNLGHPTQLILQLATTALVSLNSVLNKLESS